MKIEQYLPSKKFLYILGSFLVIGLLFFGAFKLFSNKNSFETAKKDAGVEVSNLTVNQLIQKDTDSDGIPDWEESLWGTDKNNKTTFDGVADATYVENKKVGMAADQPKEKGALTETEKFARQFFTAYSAMNASGEIDKNTINNFSSALGQKMINSNILNKYLENDVKLTKTDEPKDREDYYLAAQNLFEKYKKAGIGDELEIAGGMASIQKIEDTQNQKKLAEISKAYQGFADSLSLVPVPKSLVEYHLSIINSANNTGIATSNMSKMLEDPVVGIEGISQYEKYSNDLIKSVNDLRSFLSISDIITGTE